MSLSSYLGAIDQAWENYEGDEIAKLVSFQDSHVKNPKLQLEDPEEAVGNVLDNSIDELVAAHLRASWAIYKQRDYLEAYKCQSLTVQSFCKLLSGTKDDNWPLPIMYVLCLDLRLIAGKADQQLETKGGKPGETLEKAAEILMSCFRVCAIDSKSSDDVTKRWGMLNIVNQLFKIYFKVNKLHLCKPLIRAIDQSSLKDRYPKSQKVTYKYYVGRQLMFDNKFGEAENYLDYAFQHCLATSTLNKRSILIYLIPVKMLLGQMPAISLLKKHDLMEFEEVVSAVKEGNLLRLTDALDANEKFFIKCGIFLILEKLKIITHRNLFKKVALLMKTHQIPIDAFLAALKMMKVDGIDSEETQCIIANLIYEGKIKGYISYQHNKLVISKQNAFPPVGASL